MNLEVQNRAENGQTRSAGNSSPAIQENGINHADDNYVELKYRSTENLATAALARKIGIFSIALGLAEVLMPAPLGELAGVSPKHRPMLRLLGLREIAHGLSILQSPKPTTAVWARVGGDALDLAYLGANVGTDGSNKSRLTGAAIAVLGVAALDVLCAQKLSGQNWREVNTDPPAPTTLGQSSGRRAVNSSK